MEARLSKPWSGSLCSLMKASSCADQVRDLRLRLPAILLRCLQGHWHPHYLDGQGGGNILN
jgi:hypothetical protein